MCMLCVHAHAQVLVRERGAGSPSDENKAEGTAALPGSEQHAMRTVHAFLMALMTADADARILVGPDWVKVKSTRRMPWCNADAAGLDDRHALPS